MKDYNSLGKVLYQQSTLKETSKKLSNIEDGNEENTYGSRN